MTNRARYSLHFDTNVQHGKHHMQIDHDKHEKPKGTPDALTVISYLVAAAILIPLGWWLKANYASDLGAWIRSFY